MSQMGERQIIIIFVRALVHLFSGALYAPQMRCIELGNWSLACTA